VRANLPDEHPEGSGASDDAVPRALSGRGEGLDWFNDNTSHSGHERNHLFVNNLGAGSGEPFTDVSGISGADSPADARASVFWDYDRDGFLDLAVANGNAPKLELWHNRYGELARDAAKTARMIAVRLEGGNAKAAANQAWSARDGYGAMVVADLGEGLVLRREHRAGEGFAAQNSATLPIGIGAREKVSRLTVRWPAGHEQTTREVPAGSLVTVYEDPARSPTGEAFVVERYLRTAPPSSRRVELARETARQPGAQLVMYSTMATWCANCRAELPLLAHLRESFTAGELALYGVPTDPEDTSEKLTAWAEQHEPAYELLTDLTEEQRNALLEVILADLRVEALPSTLVTDRQGRVLAIQLGAPTVSELRRLLEAAR